MDISISSAYIKEHYLSPSMLRRFDYLKKPIVYHTLFWVVYFLFNTLRWGSYFDDYTYSFHSNLVEFPIHIVLVYFNLYYLLPKLIPAHFGRYLGLLAMAILFMSLLKIVITYELVTTDIWKESSRQETDLFGINYILAVFIGELYVIGLTTAIKMTIDYVKNQRRTRELEKINMDTELSMLKSQLQPHFFFNTLNNLYSLTLDKSDQAPETVLKLSELMSYIIYQGNQKQVELAKEVHHIHHYLDLEKLRFGQRLNIEFEITGLMGGHSIPPLILLPFIENAFKHGTCNKTGKIPLTIALEIKEKQLTFFVRNLKNNAEEGGNGLRLPQNGQGIGLKNTKRRLGLLYPDQHQLHIDEDEDHYSVNLKIPLA